MATNDITNWSEILIELQVSLVVQRDTANSYEDNYVRRLTGNVGFSTDGSVGVTSIGELEVWYLDGTRAVDKSLDIADVCDSAGQIEYEYANAVFTDGSIDHSIVEDPPSNDVLVIHRLDLLPEFRGNRLEARIVMKLAETIGYHCGAVILNPDMVGLNVADELTFQSTKDPSLFSLVI